MEQALESILINTYNQNAELRAQAEAALGQFLATSGALIALLNFIGNTNNHRELRQATGLVIKNKMRDFWSEENKVYLITPEEREIVKARLIDILLVELDNSIRGILAEAIRIVSETDFPAKWPQLLPTILTHVQSTDVLKMYNSLLALRKVAKRYEYKSKGDREPLNNIVQVSFPYLQQLMDQVIQYNSIEAAQVMKMCLKIFWSATMYELPKVTGVDVNFWFGAIARILDKVLPEASEGLEPAGQPTEPEDRAAWPWWKLKKWAARIVSQFIQRYGNPRYADKANQQFAQFFRSHTAAQLLAPVMNTLAHKSKGGFLTDEVHRMCIGYVSSCVEMSPTYKVLKPHMVFIVTEIVFPTLCLTEQDIRLFNDDPVDFVRKLHDPLGDWLSPLIAATNLLQMMARYRQKDTLPVVLPYVQSILTEYMNAAPEARDYRKKDGCLVAIASLAKILHESKEYAKTLHPFLETHVIPEFQSPVPFIRSRACWAIEYFSDLDWKGPRNGAVLQAVLKGLIQGLRDPALPVQAAAACSLRLLIEAEGAAELLKPMLPEIVNEYFRIMEEVENESVLGALQAIILKYGEEIAGMAPMIVTKLIELFHSYISAGSEDEEATFNAVQCLDTIDSVLEAVQDHPAVLAQLEPITQPMIHRLLKDGDDLYEYIDSAVHMISGFTYYADTISPSMWALCGPLLHVLSDWAIDYVKEIMVPILNFMCKGIDTFLQGSYEGQPFVVMLLNLCKNILENDESYKHGDSGCAATLITCLIISCKDNQALHPFLPQILTLIVSILDEAQEKHTRTRFLEVVMASIYYNAEAALNVLGSDPKVAPALFELLFAHLPHMERDFSQRLVVLSFSALLASPPVLLPEIVRSNFPAMFQQVIRELVLIEEEAKRAAEAGSQESEDGDDFAGFDEGDEEDDAQIDSDEDDDEDEKDPKKAAMRRAKALYVPEGGYDEEEDCLNAEDESYRQALEAMGKEEGKRSKYSGGELLEDGSDDDEMEDLSFTSPIENMNVIQHFLDTMNVIQGRDGGAALTATLQAGLGEEDRARLQGLIAIAQERAAAVASGTVV